MAMEFNGSDSNTTTDFPLHIAMLPWFAFGHINPFIQLSNKLTSHGIKISFFSIPGNIPKIKSSLTLTPSNQVVPLDIPPTVGLRPEFDSSSEINRETSELLKVALDQMQPQVKTLLSQLKPHFIFFDFAHYWIPPLASELGIKSVFFSVFSAVSNSYLTVPARMPNPENPPTIDDLKKPPLGFPNTSITSVTTFQAKDFQYLFKRFNGPTVFERLMGFLKACDALIYKSSTEMEGPYIEYIKNQCQKPVLLAGTTAPGPPSGTLEEKWETWLSQFPEKSVIFCNFGSETYLTKEQTEELTLGLELTGLPFFLVLNFGTNIDVEAKLKEALPEGFTERVKDRGVVHTGWVQQYQILAHKSVGCYVCHSGFSSVIEAIVSDCQLVLVPQKGDQFTNSKLLSGDLGVGVEVKRRDEDGWFGKEDILEAVKIVMVEGDKEPGRSIRENLEKWKEFLLDKEKEEKYIADLVEELKALAVAGKEARA